MRRLLLLVVTVLASTILPREARAHHIMGIPHYAYDEQYPQTPILTYVTELGPHDFRMTGYPGIPRPGERCTLHAYVQDRSTGAPFAGPLRLTVHREVMFGSDPVVYGPVEASLEENVFKFYPELPREANYLVRIEYEAEGVPWVVDLPLVVGEPGSPWVVLGSVLGGAGLFLVLIRAVRIKRRRTRRYAAAAGVAPS